MSNDFPNKIKFIFENISGYIPDLIVFFVLRSKIKNNFTIGPLVTGNNGEIIITKQLVESQISFNKSEFPMDYDGTLDDCDVLNILIENSSELEKRIDRLNEFYPENASMLQKIIKGASNNIVSSCKQIELPIEDKNIYIKVD